jgi:hypothetical protein
MATQYKPKISILKTRMPNTRKRPRPNRYDNALFPMGHEHKSEMNIHKYKDVLLGLMHR